ncbi:MAG: PhzF family phenazine biosynthesis protein [Cyanobacteria bacterium P01_H01_bin.105]
MNVQKIAAFSDGDTGGNPAGVLISKQHPRDAEMKRIAAEVGFSETAFAAPIEDAFRVRYFSPESEVPFCGHATIALGAALALKQGDGTFSLILNEAEITVEGRQHDGIISAALQSPLTHSAEASPQLESEVLKLFGYTNSDLDPDIPTARINGGAEHLVLGLKTRQLLAAMEYDLASGRELMNREGLVTITWVYAETPQRFHTRNPFASGGVYEDPATGAATAAFAGYLRDIGWPHNGVIDVVQGEDMGMRSHLKAEISPTLGSSIRISGTARLMKS